MKKRIPISSTPTPHGATFKLTALGLCTTIISDEYSAFISFQKLTWACI